MMHSPRSFLFGALIAAGAGCAPQSSDNSEPAALTLTLVTIADDGTISQRDITPARATSASTSVEALTIETCPAGAMRLFDSVGQQQSNQLCVEGPGTLDLSQVCVGGGSPPCAQSWEARVRAYSSTTSGALSIVPPRTLATSELLAEGMLNASVGSVGASARYLRVDCPSSHSANTACSRRVPIRPVAPMTTSSTSSSTPRFRWWTSGSMPNVEVELCRDSSCTTVQHRFSYAASATNGSATTAIGSGRWFWRIREVSAEGVRYLPSMPRPFFASSRAVSPQSSSGSMLDTDADGVAELAVAASEANNSGRIAFYRGTSAGFTTPPATISHPNGASANSNMLFAANAGDLNGDGRTDLAVGAPGQGSSAASQVFVYLANPDGTLPSTPSLTIPEPSLSSFGFAVDCAGDVNGDGFHDLVVGAPGANATKGVAYIYLGGVGGPSTTPTWTLSGAQLTNGNFGVSVSSAGDVNGDGYADVLVGQSRAEPSTTTYGSARVFFGQASTTTALQSVALGEGDTVDDAFGRWVGRAGDINGDGYSDIWIGAGRYNQLRGRVHIYYGSASGLSASSATISAPSPLAYAWFGWNALGADVNGDGFSDVVVGETDSNNYAGRAFVFLGSASGISSTAQTIAHPTGGAGYFGNTFGRAGDLDGDGRDEVVIGAPWYSNQQGRAWMFGGTSTGVTPAPTQTFSPASSLLGRFGMTMSR